RAVSAGGGVDGDGFAGVVVGANQYDGTVVDEGQIFIYHGSARGLGGVNASRASPVAPSFAPFGFSVSTAGDVNGDGFDDVIVGALGFDNGQLDEGGAFVFPGSAVGSGPAAPWGG